MSNWLHAGPLGRDNKEPERRRRHVVDSCFLCSGHGDPGFGPETQVWSASGTTKSRSPSIRPDGVGRAAHSPSAPGLSVPPRLLSLPQGRAPLPGGQGRAAAPGLTSGLRLFYTRVTFAGKRDSHVLGEGPDVRWVCVVAPTWPPSSCVTLGTLLEFSVPRWSLRGNGNRARCGRSVEMAVTQYVPVHGRTLVFPSLSSFAAALWVSHADRGRA